MNWPSGPTVSARLWEVSPSSKFFPRQTNKKKKKPAQGGAPNAGEHPPHAVCGDSHEHDAQCHCGAGIPQCNASGEGCPGTAEETCRAGCCINCPGSGDGKHGRYQRLAKEVGGGSAGRPAGGIQRATTGQEGRGSDTSADGQSERKTLSFVQYMLVCSGIISMYYGCPSLHTHLFGNSCSCCVGRKCGNGNVKIVSKPHSRDSSRKSLRMARRKTHLPWKRRSRRIHKVEAGTFLFTTMPMLATLAGILACGSIVLRCIVYMMACTARVATMAGFSVRGDVQWRRQALIAFGIAWLYWNLHGSLLTPGSHLPCLYQPQGVAVQPRTDASYQWGTSWRPFDVTLPPEGSTKDLVATWAWCLLSSPPALLERGGCGAKTRLSARFTCPAAMLGQSTAPGRVTFPLGIVLGAILES